MHRRWEQITILQRFNRYMVECELIRILDRCLNLKSFNRYMVECELYDKVTVIVLIDTWWNVNT